MLITVTGADERTKITALADMVRDYPRAEIGLLYTATPEDRPRYPRLGWLIEAAAALTGRCAIHVCGMAARRELVEGRLADLIGHAARVQVNGAVTAEELPVLANQAKMLITQHYPANAALADIPVSNHQLLVDGSAGRGISPAAWERPDVAKPVGFAGGLGPHNLAAQMEQIRAVAKGLWWVDMEGKLRTDDWFDLSLAQRAVEIFHSLPGRTSPA